MNPYVAERLAYQRIDEFHREAADCQAGCDGAGRRGLLARLWTLCVTRVRPDTSRRAPALELTVIEEDDTASAAA